MLFIISALGVAGAFILGLDGLMLGGAGELERISAIVCLAVAAGGIVGILADDGLRTRKPSRQRVERGDVLHLVAVAPILVLSVGVFLATLIPAIFVMLPFFAVWWLGWGEHRPETTTGAPAARRPLQVPAYP